MIVIKCNAHKLLNQIECINDAVAQAHTCLSIQIQSLKTNEFDSAQCSLFCLNDVYDTKQIVMLQKLYLMLYNLLTDCKSTSDYTMFSKAVANKIKDANICIIASPNMCRMPLSSPRTTTNKASKFCNSLKFPSMEGVQLRNNHSFSSNKNKSFQNQSDSFFQSKGIFNIYKISTIIKKMVPLKMSNSMHK